MEQSKYSENAMVEDPSKLRPGTVCDVEVTYSVKVERSWDSSGLFCESFPGLVVLSSVQSSVEILEEDITVTEGDGEYTVTINPIDEGMVDLTIYYYTKSSYPITSRAAFNSSDQTYYMDYVIREGVVIPKTVVELITPSGFNSIENITVIPRVTNNGLDFYGDLRFNMDNQGIIEYDEEYISILRKGLEQVSLPSDYDGPFLKQLSDGEKVVEYENQEWKPGYSEARGLVVYDDKVLITTNKALCVFDINEDFKSPILEDTFIIGYDLTVYPDDNIGVAVGNSIIKYRIKHDFALIDTNNKRVYFREMEPEFTVTEL